MSETLEACGYVLNLADIEAVAAAAYESQRKANKAGEKQHDFYSLDDNARAEIVHDIEAGNAEAISKRGPVFAVVAQQMQAAIKEACSNLIEQTKKHPEPGDEVVSFKDIQIQEAVILSVEQAQSLPLTEDEEATAYEPEDTRSIRSFRDTDGEIRFVVQLPNGLLAKR